jgi:hypothetical protein
MTNAHSQVESAAGAATTAAERGPGSKGSEPRYRLSKSLALLFQVMALVGGITLVAGFFLDAQRTWMSLLVASNCLVGLGLGGLLLVALFYVTGARWSVPFQRVPEAMTAALPVAAIGLAAVLVGCPSWYAAPAGDGLSESPLHRLWMNRPFFLARTVVYFGLWIAFAVALVGNSRRQDHDRATGPTEKNRLLSALFLVVFGVTCWLASTDWLMSLQGNWASTIFSVYNFAGIFLSALAAVIVLVIGLRRHGPLRAVLRDTHFHDLGTLLFAMSSFWMYTWFCQYLLIWYVNNPEETEYFRVRSQGHWPAWLYLDLALNWVVPFVVLLSRSAKRNPWILGTVSLLVLAGRWVDLSLMILPTQGSSGPFPGPLEAGWLLGTAGVFFVVFFWNLQRAPLLPTFARAESAVE